MRTAAHVAAEHFDRAALDPACAGDEREQGGLADTVRADQADHAGGRNGEIEVVHGTDGM